MATGKKYPLSVRIENDFQASMVPYAVLWIEEIRQLEAKCAKLAAALSPFATFATKFDEKPIRRIGDAVYGIHLGTKWEAVLRISDCRKARIALKE